ncbi:uncharacterized protein PV09_07934 [Verruconis gallopava]|uniref:Uncharacterized protein n=1 Tax=Verruconis gallopava TaxID=253628 RepID=A0A0D1XEH5_9PEZI|nr:uncharacterized protein PV09_07934 [Verruconis gallopava]KIW00581.1 hypothetical protein PV09_07934 [Verruconis gallopava]
MAQTAPDVTATVATPELVDTAHTNRFSCSATANAVTTHVSTISGSIPAFRIRSWKRPFQLVAPIQAIARPDSSTSSNLDFTLAARCQVSLTPRTSKLLRSPMKPLKPFPLPVMVNSGTKLVSCIATGTLPDQHFNIAVPI